MTNRMIVRNFGPIREADVTFGNLTVIVGPQASGKSVFLETFKLTLDRNHIIDVFRDNNVSFNGDPRAFIDGYYGRGMGESLDKSGVSTFVWEGRQYFLKETCRKKKGSGREEKVFYIPAQRVVSMPGGQTQSFSNFQFGDPFVLRHFAHQVHLLVQNEFGSHRTLFPVERRLTKTLRTPLNDHIFSEARLEIEVVDFTRRLTIKPAGHQEGLPYLAWSAGQREFVPLLLSIYWLCPAGRVARRNAIEWVVIEEPEMGLHPRAISAFLLIVLELMQRGYRVIISTHSPTVLDMVWALRVLQENKGDPKDIYRMFSVPANPATKRLAKTALQAHLKVWYFDREKGAIDISSLDPEDSNRFVAFWGGLVEFSGQVMDVVARQQVGVW